MTRSKVGEAVRAEAPQKKPRGDKQGHSPLGRGLPVPVGIEGSFSSLPFSVPDCPQVLGWGVLHLLLLTEGPRE